MDDVVTSFIRDLISARNGLQHVNILPEYSLSLDDLAKQIKAFKNCRTNLISEQVGSGITRCLYATYISFLPLTQFVYDLPQYRDERGVFVEMLKTKSSGQFSFFTAYPGVTRGGHYHHSKSEKFIIVKGNARFCFRHIVSGEQYTVIVSGEKHQVVETVPGWAHDITNIGQEELIVMLWVNEIFDRNMPDTIRCEV